MTEKRFCIESNGIWDNNKQLSWGELCNVLNELADENEQLKKKNRLLARFIRRNHDVTMISRILNELGDSE